MMEEKKTYLTEVCTITDINSGDELWVNYGEYYGHSIADI